MSEDPMGHREPGELEIRLFQPSNQLACRACYQRPAAVEPFMWVMSFLVFTRHARYVDILCESCATRTGLKEIVKSALLGWWGFPWGLMTFKALGVNARSLARWSNLNAPSAMLVGLAGLALPIGLVFWLIGAETTDRQAKSVGDFAPTEVVELVDRGVAEFQAGDSDAALATLLEADRRHPGSRSINVLLAGLYRVRGDLVDAEARARRAAAINPRDRHDVCFHGLILAEMGQDAAARRIAERAVPLDTPDVDALERTVELRAALAEPDRVLAALPPDDLVDPEFRQLAVLHDLRTGAPEAFDRMTDLWLAEG